MTKHRAKVGSIDELEGEIVCAIGHAEIEHASDVPVVEQGGQPGFAQDHGDECLGHPSNAEPLHELILAKGFGERRHRRAKVPQSSLERAAKLSSLIHV